MGTWDIGPFDNDEAADFAGTLDRAPVRERARLLRDALRAAAEEAGYLEGPDGARAVAAAALVAAARTGGGADSAYGPREPLPPLPDDLAALAARALDRVLAEDSELRELWEDSGDAAPWAGGVTRVRDALRGAGPLRPP
ncbi:DUF4259 domain-containing protein [Streptomyces sp. B1866]|uniref:DUF4259 domain-containing protein n=1 Tax=Streptomyces sp. B1866 TaxID=3075431 RepID=UPI00288FF2D0|nr:DUF4259 domain-containing protein [Streptomyces sp. B1866]MDT3399519.1 DUF4259 domain-containing protein [Streptomyces sp. B1866]